MKIIVALTSLLISTTALAESIVCQVTEFSDGNKNLKYMVVKSENDPHGGFQTFKSEMFPEVSGFVSLLKKDSQFFAVMSLYSEKLGSNSSGQYQMVVDGQYAQLQLIIPSESLKMSGVEIVCKFSTTLN